MFSFEKNQLTNRKAYKYRLFKQNEALSFGEFIETLSQNNTFRKFFIHLLDNIPLRAYHWETPPITIHSQQQLFEFVVTRSPGIDLPPEPGPFRQYFDPNKNVAVFDNLGGDAKLIAPTVSDKQLNYSHIGVFTDQAPEELQKEFWQTVGRVTSNHLSDNPIWLNTAGGGVAWLHIRLDSRPKYYLHHPYCTMS